MFSRVFALIVVVSGLIVWASPTLYAQTQTASQLREAERKRADQERQKKEAEATRLQMLKNEKSILGVLDEIERRVETGRHNIAVLQKRVASLKTSINATEREIAGLTDKRHARRELLADRLRAHYKINYLTPNGYVGLAFQSDNVSDVLVRLRYLTKIREKDDSIIDTYLKDEQRLIGHKRDLVREESRLANEEQTLREEQTLLARERERRESTLSTVRKDRALKERAIKELDASLREMTNLISRLERLKSAEDRTTSGSRPSSAVLGSTDEIKLAAQTLGTLSWPVQGKIISNVSPALEGITIKANEGTPVKAVKDGTVEYAERFNGLGFGNLVVVNHGNGYRSFYAHLSEFKVKQGDKVTTGQSVGSVGSTGSLVGAVLYFEMRHNFNVINFQKIVK
ncbi:MAG: peptidoglycan DD-metalloendopeptidase family protein [Candidatus Poribacteria bacterium]|nr:peptidoglycan DD-metalloendopeptidase family protein [Candidatus Poribacteria bacterium]